MHYKRTQCIAWLLAFLGHVVICLLGVQLFKYSKDVQLAHVIPVYSQGEWQDLSKKQRVLLFNDSGVEITHGSHEQVARTVMPAFAGMTTAPRFAHGIRSLPSAQSDNHHALLLTLLHQTIATKQIYPQEAILLNQSGSVKVTFELQPNGTITQLTILHSSGTPSLDSAAEDAVKAITPFAEAKRYLKKAEVFKLEVVYG